MNSSEAGANVNMSEQLNGTNNMDPNNGIGVNDEATSSSQQQQHQNIHSNSSRILGSSKKAVPAAIQHPSQASKYSNQQQISFSPQVTASSSSSSSIPPMVLQKAISSVLPQPHQLPLLPQASNESSQQPVSRLSKYTRIRIIGRGAYGIVSLVRNLSGQYLAMKEVDQMKLRKDSKAHQAYMEKIVCNFSHPGIPQFHSCFRQGDKLYFVMAYVEGELLSSLIKRHQDLLTEQIIQFYIAEIVLTLEYIHSLGFSHRDLKAENLVLTKEGHIQLIDYGTLNDYCKKLIPPEALENVKAKDAHRRNRITSKKKSELAKQLDENGQLSNPGSDMFSENRGLSKRIKEIQLSAEDQEDIEKRIRCQTFCGTAEYLCPEMLEDQCCEMSGDLWALGCLIYKLFTSETPFIDESQLLIFQRIKQGNYNKTHEKIPQTAQYLIDALLVADSHSRLGSVIVDENTTADSVHQAYSKLKAHPFFNGIQWESLYSNSPPKCVADMLNTIRNPAFKANTPKDITDFCNNDSEDDDDEDGFGDEQAIDKLRKTFDPSRNASTKSQSSSNQPESPKKLVQLRKSEGSVLTKTKSSPAKNRSNDNLQSFQKNSLEPHARELTYTEIVSSFNQPFTMENLFFQVQIIKVNKHLLVFSTKKPRQILLFNVEPITIIYYIPMSQKPSIKKIILDDSTQIVLESQEKIIFQDATQKYIFQETKGNSPALLYDAIERLKKQRAKGQ